jgi:hypothetical protein
LRDSDARPHGDLFVDRGRAGTGRGRGVGLLGDKKKLELGVQSLSPAGRKRGRETNTVRPNGPAGHHWHFDKVFM